MNQAPDQLALFAVRPLTDRVAAFDLQAPLHRPTHHAERLHRADDVGGSIAAAADAVESGRAESEARLVLLALARHPGSTSAELADRTPDLARELGQSADAWRTTCARRLPGLEDAGLVIATAPRFSLHRPHREVDPHLQPCTTSQRTLRAIRWRRKEPGA